MCYDGSRNSVYLYQHFWQSETTPHAQFSKLYAVWSKGYGLYQNRSSIERQAKFESNSGKFRRSRESRHTRLFGLRCSMMWYIPSSLFQGIFPHYCCRLVSCLVVTTSLKYISSPNTISYHRQWSKIIFYETLTLRIYSQWFRRFELERQCPSTEQYSA